MNASWIANTLARLISVMLGLLTILSVTQSSRIHQEHGMIRQPGSGRPLTRGGRR